MKALLVVFHLPEGTLKGQHNQFRRKIYGEKTSSWEGRYNYRRKGLLDGIPHVFLYWGIIIIKKEDFKRLERELQSLSAIIKTRIIECIPEDIQKLELGSH